MFQGSASSSSNQLAYYQHGFAPNTIHDYGYNQAPDKLASSSTSKKSGADLIKYKNMTDSAVATEDSGSGKKAETAVSDFEYNQKLDDDQNSMDSSTSSSASSESDNPEKIKEAIRRFAEGTKTNQDAINKSQNRKASVNDSGMEFDLLKVDLGGLKG